MLVLLACAALHYISSQAFPCVQAGGEAAAKRKPLVALARESITEYATIVKRVVTDTARVAVQRAAGLGGAAAAAGQQAGQQQQQHAQGSLDSVVEFKDDWGADTIAQVGALVRMFTFG